MSPRKNPDGLSRYSVDLSYNDDGEIQQQLKLQVNIQLSVR